nr:PREDICTED: caspase-10 isoform X1 [Anolis carolinensis]|eukprot:XP_008118735.1 PREDICTED: caspase-10 isoform X1 [Anolis carolinensis]
MDDDDGIKFRQILLAIDENLGKEDVDAMKFLCSDFISTKHLEGVETAQDIFQLLINRNLLSKEDTFIVAELLYRIKCHFLLQKIGYTQQKVEHNLFHIRNVSEYRQMLYEISEGFTEENVKTAMFLLREHLPKKQSIASGLELLTSLEKQDLLAEDKLAILEKICNKVSPELRNKVDKFKERSASDKESKGIENSSLPGFQDASFGNVSLWEHPFLYPVKKPVDSYSEEFGSLREHGEIFSSLPANQDVKAGITSGPSEQPIGNEKSKCASEASTCYKMDGLNRGSCLIFNNVHFEGGLSQRRGSQKDAEELESVFRWLGLDVIKYNDTTSIEMENHLKQWQSFENWKDMDCLVCCILSHGESGKIYGTDGNLIPIRTIMSYFTAKQCPQLAKKPKLFFIQACQGEKTQQPVYLETDDEYGIHLKEDAQSSGSFPLQQMISSIPEEADFLLGMATVDGYLSFRHVHQGTWYIQALCDKLRTLVPRGEDILSILTEVNADVSRRADAQGQKKQMPQPAYTLRKKLIFPIP